MILLVLFSQEQDQSRAYCGKIHSLTLCLRKCVKKKCLWRSLPLIPRLLVASGGTGEARGRATPPFPLHCSHPRGTTLHQGPILPASGIGHNAGTLAFLAAC